MIEAPSPFGDATARLYYVIFRALVERGHRVTAFAASSKPEEIARAKALFPQPGYDLRCYEKPYRHGLQAKFETLRRPYSYMFGENLRADLERELLAGFDVLHLEQLASGWVGLDHAERSLVGVNFLFSIDSRAGPIRTLNGALEQVLKLRAERRLLRSFRFFRAGTSRLVAPIRQRNPAADITPIPIGLDPSLYQYVSNARRPKKPIISLIGSMEWGPTYSAAVRMLTRLYPEIRRRVPDAHFQIAGWSARSRLQEYTRLPDVEIVENVPEITPFFENASVLLYAPVCGSGIKVKVLEAMAYGVPVITTADGVEGLPAADSEHAGIASDDDGLIERTVALLTDPELQNRQRKAARELIEAICNPSQTATALEQIYQRIVHPGLAGDVVRAQPQPKFSAAR
jgi:glycosyltransferase involved in cell wall biosynthesis